MGSAWCSEKDNASIPNGSLPPSVAGSMAGDIDTDDIDIPANYYSMTDLEKFKFASKVEELSLL